MRILVIGSVNMDVVTRVDHVPAAGENVRGRDLATIPGGKGANQAVAAARLGAETALLGRVGDDEFGSRLRAELQAEGISVESLDTVRDCASGVAQGNGCERVPAFKIDPVDTTASGDAFTAALAIEAVRGTDLVAAARVANAAGALACLTLGAQPSMPTAEEVAEFLADQSQAG